MCVMLLIVGTPDRPCMHVHFMCQRHIMRQQRLCLQLVHIGDDPVWHQLAVLVPVLAILGPAGRIVPPLPVYEQYRKVDAVEVGRDGLQAAQAARHAP
jgi:hypothetical protein